MELCIHVGIRLISFYDQMVYLLVLILFYYLHKQANIRHAFMFYLEMTVFIQCYTVPSV